MKRKITINSNLNNSYFLINRKKRLVFYEVEALKKLQILKMQPFYGQPVMELVDSRYTNTFSVLLDHCFEGRSVCMRRVLRFRNAYSGLMQITVTPICISDQISYLAISMVWESGASQGSGDDLSYMTSHQLRGPLSNILSLSDLLTHPSLKTFNYSKLRGLLTDINQQAKQLDDIVIKINSLLNQDLNKAGFRTKSIKQSIKYIMLVDDDPMVNRLHKMILSKYPGKKVLTFSDPIEALESIDYEVPDLLFLDLNMPVISGFEFLEKLHHKSRAIDVIIVSSSIDTSEKIRASTYDFVKDFFSKPLTHEKVEKLFQ